MTMVSLFCFAVVMPLGFEPSFLESQYAENAGLFACDGHLVFSNVSSASLFNKHYSSIYTAVIPGQLRGIRGRDGVVHDSGAFITVWGQIFADGRFRSYDWTVKIDVDALVLPTRLRGLLAYHCHLDECGPVYVRGKSSRNSGPIEAISLPAMKYYAGAGEHCASLIDHASMSASEYLAACMDSLMIERREETNLVSTIDGANRSPDCDKDHAAFYPVRSWALAFQCLQQSGMISLEDVNVKVGFNEIKMLCFAAVWPFTEQAVLVAAQFVNGIGIFSCDSYVLFSNASSNDVFPPGIHPARWPRRPPEVKQIRGRDGRYCAGPESSKHCKRLFFDVWIGLLRDARYRQHDWVLKFEPDVVFNTNRVRSYLSSQCPATDVACPQLRIFAGSGHDGVSVEMVSRAALAKLSANVDVCNGLDEFGLCLATLKVGSVAEPELLSDGRGGCDVEHMAFEHFNTWETYLKCLQQAGHVVTQEAPTAYSFNLESQPSTPSLFCFTLVMPTGWEPNLLRRQYKESVGIFSCNDYIIVSNASAKVVFQHADIEVKVINRDLDAPKGGRYMTSLNSLAFIEAWHVVFEDKRYLSHRWTVKIDSDAVVVPQRLRGLLDQHCPRNICGHKYLTNFGQDLHGPVEAISLDGMQKYAAGVDRCLTEIDYSDKGEDWYLGLCLDLLRIEAVEEPRLLSDWHDHGEACDTLHAVFHPFKRWDRYFGCLCEAGLAAADCPVWLRSTSTSRRPTTTTRLTSTPPAQINESRFHDFGRSHIPDVASRRTTTTTTKFQAHEDVVIVDSSSEEAGSNHQTSWPSDSDQHEHHAGNRQNHSESSSRSSFGLPYWFKEIPLKSSKGKNVLIASTVGIGSLSLSIFGCLCVTWHYRRARMRKLEANTPTLVPTSPIAADTGEVKMPESLPGGECGVTFDGFDANMQEIADASGAPLQPETPPANNEVRQITPSVGPAE